MTQMIIIDSDIMNKYKNYYFRLYPKRKKFPKYFQNPIPLSLNKFIAMKRMAQNDVKGKYGEFAVWLAEYYHINDLNLNKVCFTYRFYFKNRQRHDIDNYTLSNKFLADGFVKAKVLIDDNSGVLELKFKPFKVDKAHPRVEIEMEYK